MNPYEVKKESAAYLGQKSYRTYGSWVDTDELDLYVEGPHLLIGSITFTVYNDAKLGTDVGFRLTDALREKTNKYIIPAQYSVKGSGSNENLCTFSFHLVHFCRGLVQLQVYTIRYNTNWIVMNWMGQNINQAPNHKTICTLSAIPLGGIEEQIQGQQRKSKPPYTIPWTKIGPLKNHWFIEPILKGDGN